VKRYAPVRTVSFLFLLPMTLFAQTGDIAPLRPWPAPLYWQPSATENRALAEAQKLEAFDTIAATTPANALIFVAMTPCRIVDTRIGSGFTGAFGEPSLIGTVPRTFPIQSSTTCTVPSIAQAYSFNMTAVPSGFFDFLTLWPTGQTRPNASTLNGYTGTVIANAAIVPAGTAGSVDVYASQSLDIIIDINGYYATQSGITLAVGSAAAPSLSFSGDPGTGIYSSGAGALNIAAGGTSRLRVLSSGNSNLSGNFDISGNLTMGGTLAIGTVTPVAKLDVQGGQINASGGLCIAGVCQTNGNSAVTRSLTYLAGCDGCGPLTAADSQRTIYMNVVGPMTITSVTCFSDADSPLINIRHDTGSGQPADVLTSNLPCSTSGATSTSIAALQSTLNPNDKLDFVIAGGTGVAKRATVVIKTIVN
jgi:hypothetical protein